MRRASTAHARKREAATGEPRSTMASTASSTSAGVMLAIERPFQRGRASFSRIRFISSDRAPPLALLGLDEPRQHVLESMVGRRLGQALEPCKRHLVGSWILPFRDDGASASLAASRAAPRDPGEGRGPSVSFVGWPVVPIAHRPGLRTSSAGRRDRSPVSAPSGISRRRARIRLRVSPPALH